MYMVKSEMNTVNSGELTERFACSLMIDIKRNKTPNIGKMMESAKIAKPYTREAKSERARLRIWCVLQEQNYNEIRGK